jgi:hypothetical protein
MAATRPVRMCDVCGGVDTDPRHVFGVAPGDGATSPEAAGKATDNAGKDKAAILLQIMDNSTVMRHMDCCREAGCPDGSCDEVTAGAEDLRGPALVKHLTNKKG